MTCGFVRSKHESPVFLPAFSYSAGFSSALLNRAAKGHARSHRSSHRFEHWPTALQRSDEDRVSASRRCRTNFRAMFWRRDVYATDVGMDKQLSP